MKKEFKKTITKRKIKSCNVMLLFFSSSFWPISLCDKYMITIIHIIDNITSQYILHTIKSQTTRTKTSTPSNNY